MKIKIPCKPEDSFLYSGEAQITRGDSFIEIEGQLDWIIRKVQKPQFMPIPGFKAGPLYEKERKLREYSSWVEAARYLVQTYLQHASSFFNSDRDTVKKLVRIVRFGNHSERINAINSLKEIFGVEIDLRMNNYTQQQRCVIVIAEDVNRALQNEPRALPLTLPDGKPVWKNEEVSFKEV